MKEETAGKVSSEVSGSENISLSTKNLLIRFHIEIKLNMSFCIHCVVHLFHLTVSICLYTAQLNITVILIT